MGKYNTVVFRIDFQEGMEFPEISNFIYKVENHEKLTLEEVQHISFQYYRVSEKISEDQWAEEIRRKSKSYFYIKNPEQIVNLDDSYQIIYGIILDEAQLKDVVEIQNLYLIKNNLKKACILGLLSGTDSYYFKMSQYLSSVYEHYPEFYNQVWFYKDKPVRLQLHNLQYSRYFMPLQIINEKTVDCLFQKAGDVIRREDIERMIFSKVKLCMDTGTESIIGGAVKILQKHSKYLSRIGAEEFSRLMADVNLLTLVFFAYFIKTMGKKSDILHQWTYAGVRNCLIQMEQYAHACRQLAENIVFHSRSGEGCLSLRIHSGTTKYIKEKYMLTESEADTYFEIEISDYAADNAGGNIAENFQKSLSDAGSALIFKGMTPKDFLESRLG